VVENIQSEISHRSLMSPHTFHLETWVLFSSQIWYNGFENRNNYHVHMKCVRCGECWYRGDSR